MRDFIKSIIGFTICIYVFETIILIFTWFFLSNYIYLGAEDWLIINFIPVISILYGLSSVLKYVDNRDKITKNIKNRIRFCNFCGNEFNLKEEKSCPHCNHNLFSFLKIKFMNRALIEYSIIFGLIIIFIVLNIIFSSEYWFFIIMNYLVLVCTTIFIFRFIKNDKKSTNENLTYIKKSLNYCINCGNTLDDVNTFKCENCGYIFPIKELEEF